LKPISENIYIFQCLSEVAGSDLDEFSSKLAENRQNRQTCRFSTKTEFASLKNQRLTGFPSSSLELAAQLTLNFRLFQSANSELFLITRRVANAPSVQPRRRSTVFLRISHQAVSDGDGTKPPLVLEVKSQRYQTGAGFLPPIHGALGYEGTAAIS
jgi:hypothetical protein